MTIRSKLLLFVVPYAAATAGLTTALGYVAARRVLIASIEARSRAILVGFDRFHAVVGGLKRRDERTLREPLMNLVAGGALSAAALDPGGRVIAHSNRGERGKIYGNVPTPEQLRHEAPIVERVEIRGQAVIRATLPVWASEPAGPATPELGAIQVLFPLGPGLATAEQLSGTLAGVIIGIMALATMVLLLALNNLLKPIWSLTALTRRMNTGTFGDTITVESRDEIGELGRSFNELSGRLARTTVSRNYFEAVLDQVLSAVIVADARGRIERLNAAAATTLAPGADGLVGHRIRRLIRRGSLAIASREKGRMAGEAVIVASRGEVPALIGISRLRTRDGRRKLILSFRDISRLKRAQSELALANSRLEEFLRITAHDLQEPIRGIAMNARRLEQAEDSLPPQLRAPITPISRQTRRLTAVLGALLAYSAVGLGDERPESVDLSTAFDAALKQLADEIAAAHAVVRRGHLPTAVIRPSHARELFWQLISNAVRFRGRSSPRIEVSSVRHEGRCVVSLTDNGIGIEKDAMPLLFRPFARINVDHPKRGPGVGLAICRRIVELAGGRIWAESEPGAGSTFSVSFPQEDA